MGLPIGAFSSVTRECLYAKNLKKLRSIDLLRDEGRHSWMIHHLLHRDQSDLHDTVSPVGSPQLYQVGAGVFGLEGS